MSHYYPTAEELLDKHLTELRNTISELEDELQNERDRYEILQTKFDALSDGIKNLYREI